MTTLTRWEPFRELTTMRDVMDRFFDEPFLRLPTLWERDSTAAQPLALDLVEETDKYIVKASVPGVKPEDVEVTLNNNVLTIKGETKEENEKKEGEYHMRERRYGSFYRSVTLPANVKAEKIEAVNENGVLTLTLPKAEEAKPKRIAVKNLLKA